MAHPLLLVAHGTNSADILEAALQAAGQIYCRVAASATWPGEAQALAVPLVLLAADRPDAAILGTIRSAADVALPVALFTHDPAGADIPGAIAAGAAAYATGPLDQSRVKALLIEALARFQAENRLRHELAAALARLEERKLIDRAKGIVMREAGCSEDEAYRRLRKAAMDQNRRIAEVAEQVLAVSALLDEKPAERL